jgi:hypothetical protein
MWSELDDNETIVYYHVNMYKTPLRNLIGIFQGKEIEHDVLNMKNFKIIPIFHWINTENQRNMNLSSLHNEIIQKRILSFTEQDNLKISLATFYYHSRRVTTNIEVLFNEFKEFLKDIYPNIILKSDVENIIQRKVQEDEKLLEKDLKQHEKLQGIKKTLESYPSLPVSSIEYEKLKLECFPKWLGRNPSIDDGPKIFDSLSCDENMSIIFYNGSDKSVFSCKFYQDVGQKYNQIRKSISENLQKITEESHTITIIFPKMDSMIVYDLKLNKMIIDTPYEKDIVPIIEKNSNYSLSLGELIKISISGSFKIYNIGIVEPIFFDMILQEELLSLFLAYDEFENFYPMKKKFFYHFKLPLLQNYEPFEPEIEYETIPFEKTLIFFISQDFLPSGSWVKDYHGNLMKIERDNLPVPYLNIRFLRSISEEFTQQFFFKINKLLSFYLNKKDEYVKIYSSFFPKASLKEKAVIKKKIRAKNLKTLQAYAPDLFISKYARKCQEKRQPTILTDPNEIEEWTKQEIVYGGEVRKREVMEYAGWNFVCKSDKYPFPGLRRNIDLPNREKYPFIPCCFEKPQMDKGLKTQYNRYILGENPLEVRRKGHVITTGKVLSPGRNAFVPSVLEFFFGSLKVFRRGTVLGPNSFLHAVLDAIDKKGYNFSEDFVKEERKKIAQSVFPSLCKQELYDYSFDEIKEMIAGRYEYFDSSLFYRAVEEYYQVNIFVFLYFPAYHWDVIRTSLSDKILSLEVPRHYIFYSRRIRRNWPTIIIFKHRGPESESLRYPQHELIVTENEKIFSDERITVKLFRMFHSLVRVYRWNKEFGFSHFPRYSEVFDQIEKIIGEKMVRSQIIDKAGKMRAIITVHGITLVIPPTRPENFPTEKKITRAPLKVVKEAIYGEISGYSTRIIDGEKYLVGVWYVSGFDGIYVPVEMMKFEEIKEELDKLPEHHEQILTEKDTQESVHEKSSTILKIIRVLMQVFLWVSQISQDNDWRSYVKIKKELTPVEKLKRILEIPLDLPKVKNAEEGINYLSEYCSEIFRNGQIYISEKMLYAVEYFLNVYKRSGKGEVINKVVKNWPEDSIPHFMTRKISSKYMFDIWINDVKNVHDNVLHRKIVTQVEERVPKFLRVIDNYCLVVKEPFVKDIRDALLVSKVWKLKRVAVISGNDLERFEKELGKFDMEKEKYKIFGLNDDGFVVLNVDKGGDYYWALVIQEKIFMALLVLD